MAILVSACLLGVPCRHDGRDKHDPRVLEALRGEELVPICPEVAGGMPIPRAPAFRDGDRVLERGTEVDVTAQFLAGARVALEAAREHRVRLAILKQNSPSCGSAMTGVRAGRGEGRGVTAELLMKAGFEVRGEESLVELKAAQGSEAERAQDDNASPARGERPRALDDEAPRSREESP